MAPAPTPSLDRIEALATARLRLRPVDEADLPALLAVYGDAQVVRHLPHGAWQSAADASAWLGRMRALAAAGSGRVFAVAARDGGAALGTVLLFRHDAASARAELAYALQRTHWGRGLMHEALTAFCGAAFAQAGLQRLEAEALPENRASNRLLAALGFRLEGRLRQRWRVAGEGRDVHHWGLLAGEARR